MLTRNESNALRGFAILGIMLHNYTHWLGPMVKENEYAFSVHNVRRLMMELSSFDGLDFAHLLSFFGHYGVPVFLFLSAYGLVMKYEAPRGGESKDDGALSFIWKHYKKLFAMMIVGYGLFVMVDYMTPGPRHYTFWNVIGQIGMFSNFYEDPDHAIWPGPYWYFGLMVQVYIVYRLVFYRGRQSLAGLMSESMGRNVLLLLMFISVVLQIVFEPESMSLTWYRYNIFGSLLPFGMGIIYARAVKSEGKEFSLLYKLTEGTSRSTQFSVCLLCAFLILYMSLNFYSWMLVPAVVCVFSVLVVKLLPQRSLSPMVWVGGISAWIFVLHPIARKVIIPISRRGDLYAGLILYTVAAIVLAMIFSRLMSKK